MQIVKRYLLGILLCAFGCSTDLDIMEDGQPMPVIYAMINPYDTVHYVRVQKTFKINVKEDWPSLNPDSLHFKEVEVYLSGLGGDSIKWIEKLEETTVVKQEGFFPSGNYQVFKIDHKLPINIIGANAHSVGKPDIDSLILEVRINDFGIVCQASDVVLPPLEIINYKSRYEIYAYGSKPSLYSLSYVGETSEGVNTVYRQIEFKVHYKDHFTDQTLDREIHWLTYKGFDGLQYFMSPAKLFYPISELIPDDDSVLFRTLDSIDIALMRPTNVFNHYFHMMEMLEWEDNDFAPYSNFDNAYGMFFGIIRDEWTGMKLHYQEMDTLCFSESYKYLKFRK